MDPDRRIAAGLFIVVFVTYAYFFGGGGWNQNALFDLTRAIVEQRTFQIDAYATNTYDISMHDGHVYANKPPGTSILGVVPYAIVWLIERATGANVNASLVMTFNLYFVTAAVCGMTGALIPSLMFLFLRRRLEAEPLMALAVALMTAFGTYLFAYSTVFFNHVPSAAFLLWAFTRMSVAPENRPWLAGFLAGVAGICNYLCVPIAALLLMFCRTRRQAVAFIAGAVPCAVALMIYQAVCFGSPFRSAVEATSPVFLTQGAAMGVFVGPRLDALIGILLSPRRGLFYLSPVLIFGIAGLVNLWRRRELRREALFVTIAVLFFLGVNISFNNWDAGSAIGPRYILPIVPFLGWAMYFAFHALRPLWSVLAAVAIITNFVVTTVNPLPSRTIGDPIRRYAIPLFITGRLPADTPMHPPLAWKRMLGHVSVNRHAADEFVPLMKYGPRSPQGDWASFNLGESLLPGQQASVVPIVLWMILGSAALVHLARQGVTPPEDSRRPTTG